MALSLFDDAPPVNPLPVNVTPWKHAGPVTLYHGDNLPILRAMPARSVDAAVTDPPYGIGFMGKEWDTFNPQDLAENERKALRPTHGFNLDDPRRTNPNLKGRERSPAMSPSQIEYDRGLKGQRGFQRFTEVWAREMMRVLKPGAHLVVCGAPRSAHRMVCGLEDAGFEIRDSLAWLFGQGFPKSHNLDNGWGTALKPGHEPIALARKPFEGTVEDKVEIWGTGALNIAGCRLDAGNAEAEQLGRWPANVLLDLPAASLLDAQRGGASRFFFVAKPSRAERDFGCEELPVRTPGECTERAEGSRGITPYAGAGRSGGGRNFHPTVKPVALMRWLIRLVTPPGGTVCDPFLGSGTSGMAALLEGCTFIGIEREAEYLPLADARIAAILAEVSAC